MSTSIYIYEQMEINHRREDKEMLLRRPRRLINPNILATTVPDLSGTTNGIKSSIPNTYPSI